VEYSAIGPVCHGILGRGPAYEQGLPGATPGLSYHFEIVVDGPWFAENCFGNTILTKP